MNRKTVPFPEQREGKEIRTETKQGNTRYVVVGCYNDQGRTVSEKVKHLIRLEAKNIVSECDEI